MLGRGTVPRAVELWCAREDGDSRSGDAPGLLTIRGDGTSLSDKLATHTDAQGLPDLLVGARWRIVSVGLLGVWLWWLRRVLHDDLGHADDDGASERVAYENDNIHL